MRRLENGAPVTIVNGSPARRPSNVRKKRMQRAFILLATVVFLHCAADRPDNVWVAKAREFGSYAHMPQMASLSLAASAAGADCQILFIRARVPLRDATVEAIHYGAGDYTVYEGGVQQFARDRQFRAVAYTDLSNNLWTYGATTRVEAASLEICQ